MLTVVIAHHKFKLMNWKHSNLVEVKVPYEVEKKVPFPVKIFIPQPYAVHKHQHGHHHQQHHSHHSHDHQSDYSNRFQQQVAAASSGPSQSSQSSEQSSSSEYNDYLPRPEHLRSGQNQQQTTKLFAPYQNQASASSPQQEERPYNQQHQLHHQQQYVSATMRKDMLPRNRLKYNSDEDSDSSSSEFRPVMGSSMEDGAFSATNNVETVVPPPPSLSSSASGSSPSSVRPFHINVPERLPNAQALSTSSAEHSDAAVSTHNQYQQNIEIPVHVFQLQLQPIEPGQGFAIAS